MDQPAFKELLRKYGLKLTLPRQKVLEVFFSAGRAITYIELLRLTNLSLDRVTVHRTLKLFEDKEIIHRIYGSGGTSYYALSHAEETTQESNPRQHLHFSCIRCKSVYCLDDQLVPLVSLPEFYEVLSLEWWLPEFAEIVTTANRLKQLSIISRLRSLRALTWCYHS